VLRDAARVARKLKQHAKTGTNPLYIEFDWLRLPRASVRGHHANEAKDFLGAKIKQALEQIKQMG
jgi:hypothetical protein